MPLTLHAHPFSSFCQKALVALYENGTDFTLHQVNLGDTAAAEALGTLWPFRRFPVLVDDGIIIPEASIIIEHLDLHHPGPRRMLPADPAAALEVRLIDRVIDNDVMVPIQKIVFDVLRPADTRDPRGVAEARARLETAYGWLDARLAGRCWAAGPCFSLADCGAAPGLLYADWTHPIDARFTTLRAYRARLLARPSYARALEEARPFRGYFPLGDPGRD